MNAQHNSQPLLRRDRLAISLVALGVILAGCGDGDESRLAATTIAPATVTTAVPFTPTTASRPNVIPLENCPYSDVEGKRQPLVSENPLKARVHGLCDPDPSAPVGVYPTPNQVRGTSVDVVQHGEEVEVHCFSLEGDEIANYSGHPNTKSTTWAEITTPRGKRGKIPEAWLGFIDEVRLIQSNTSSTCG